MRKYFKKSALLLSFELIFSLGFLLLADSAWASTWIQTDWSGGSGQQTWSDNTKYWTDDGNVVNNDPAGDLKLVSSSWLTGWGARKPITITNNTATELTYFQVKINVTHVSGKMENDFGDIRFTKSDGNTPIDYWRESYVSGTSAVFWVEVPSIPASSEATIYMYYDKSGESTTSSGPNTFVWFNDFESTVGFDAGLLNPTQTAGSAKTGSWGIYGAGAGAYRQETRNNVNSGRDLIWETWVRGKSTSSNCSLSGIGIGHPHAGTDSHGYQAYIDERNVVGIRLNFSSGSILCSQSVTINWDTWYFISFYWTSSDELGMSVYTDPNSDPIATCSTTHTTYTDGEYGVAAYKNADWDDYRVRKYASTEPSTEAGSEETSAGYVSSGLVNSSVYNDSAQNLDITKVEWTENTPSGTDIIVQIRSSANSDMSSASSWETVSNGDENVGTPINPYIQYRTTLTTTNSSNTPTLQSITITYTVGDAKKFSQTDWSGGDAQDEWSDPVKYKSDDENVKIADPAGAAKMQGLWTRRRQITVNSTGTALTNFQVKVDVTYDSDMQDDFDDIRFAQNSDGTNPIDHWRQKYTLSSSATFWVEVPNIPASGNTTIYMFYGNSLANSASNGNDTFVFFDDFNDGDASGWTVYNGTWSVVDFDGSYRYYQSANTSTYMRTSNGESSWDDYILETKINIASGGGTGGFASVLFRFQDTANHYAVIMDHRSMAVNGLQIRHWIAGGYTVLNQIPFTFNFDTWYDLEVSVATEGINDVRIKVWVDDNYKGEYLDVPEEWASGKIALMMHGTQAYYDDIRVRKYASTEPTVSWNGEQSGAWLGTGEIISSKFDTGINGAIYSIISWSESVSANTNVKFQIRTADTKAGLAAATWYGPTSSSDYYETTPSGEGINPDSDGHQWVQYKVVLESTAAGETPTLNGLTIGYIEPTLVKLVSFNAIGYFDKVLVKWETDSEINNAGFNIYRSQNPNRGYVKINSTLIPGLGNSAIGKEYEFWDYGVINGITYYYKLEDVEFDGTSTMHGPVEAHPGLDSDNDGMTDDWENYYGLNPYDPADVSLDPDMVYDWGNYYVFNPYNPNDPADATLNDTDDASFDPDDDDLADLEELIQETDPEVTDEPMPPEQDEDGVKIIQSDDYGVVLELITSSFEVEEKVVDAQSYQVIKLPYIHGQTAKVGNPQVPIKGVLLGVPFDSSITIDAVGYEEEVLSGYNLYPVPHIHLEKEFPERKFSKDGNIHLAKGRPARNILKSRKILGQLSREFVKDTHTYSRDKSYPDCLAEVSPGGALRGQDVAKLKIHPIQFNPVTGELKFYKRIRIEVDFGKKAEIDWENVHEVPAPFNRLYKGLFHNYEDVKWWRRRPRRYIGAAKFTPQSAYKIAVNEEGIYRLTWEDLYDAGIDPDSLNPRRIKIYNQGKQISIYVAGERDGRFDYDDYIEFYAEAIHTRYTSTNIYWLITDGRRGRRMRIKPPLGGTGHTPISFLSRLHQEKDEMYWMEIPDKGYVDDHWFFADSLWAPCSVDFTIPLSNVAIVDEEAIIKIALHGMSYGFPDADHHTRIYLNGYLVDDTTWNGNIEYIRQLNVAQSYLVEGDNTITIELPGDSGAPFDVVLANWFEISYWRQFKAEGNILKFNNQGQGLYSYCLYSYKISDFTENDIEIFDITNPKRVKRIIRFDIEDESGIYTVSFKDLFIRVRNRNYIVLSSSTVKSPISIVEDEPSNLRFKENQADYIIITHEDFYDGILPLAEHRAAQGLSVKVVKIGDIYDEFNYGIFSPEAIKTFLRYAYSEWAEPAPTYVLLVGDGTYDYQDNEGLGCKNYVPTYMVHSLNFGETGSDNWFICLDGEDDILPDMFIGRLPVYSVEQLNTIVDKIINYETAPTENWTKKVTLVADNLDDIFTTISEGLTDYLPPEYQANKIYLGNYVHPADCKANIIEAINQGTLILNYVGHGSVVRWAHETILRISDIPFLTNLDRLPFISTMTCANGYFVYPPGFFNCIAEELLYSSSGGVVAILAPTGISYPDIQELFDKGLFESIFVEDNFCLGVATTQGKLRVFENAGEGGENVIQTFPLFGDPALELKR